MNLYPLLVSFAVFSTALAVELTFELPDNAKQCFHEDIRQGVDSTVEFQVRSLAPLIVPAIEDLNVCLCR